MSYNVGVMKKDGSVQIIGSIEEDINNKITCSVPADLPVLKTATEKLLKVIAYHEEFETDNVNAHVYNYSGNESVSMFVFNKVRYR